MASETLFYNSKNIVGIGSVGIGTTNPTSITHIYGDTPLLTLQTSSAVAGHDPQYRLLNSAGTFKGCMGYSISADYIYFLNDTINNQMIIYNSTSTFGSGINFIGNVGIGKTNPGYPLTVATGSGQFNTAVQVLESTHATSRRAGLVLGENAGSWLLGQDINGNGTRDFFIYGGSSASTKFYIGTGGTVGIGTVNTSYKLVVDNGSTTAIHTVLQASGITTGNVGLLIGKALSQANCGTVVWQHVGDGLSTNYLGLGYYNGDAKLNIKADGNVGIGTTNPSYNLVIYNTSSPIMTLDTGTYSAFFQEATNGTLYVRTGAGASGGTAGVYMTSGATGWTANSDSRLKNIIEPISNAISKVQLLNPVLYSWKTDETNTPHPGLIAQDVIKIQPECVSTNNEGMYGVQYTELIPLAFAAIQELSAENTALKSRLDSLEARLAAAGL